MSPGITEVPVDGDGDEIPRDPDRLGSLAELVLEEFPLAAFMQVEPLTWTEAGLELRTPAGPNLNAHGTMFGGGIAALALLTGWGWVRLELEARGIHAEVVVQDARTHYERPIRGDCRARCLPPEPAELDRFLRTLRRRGKGRLAVRVQLRAEGDPEAPPAALMEARFVARVDD
ncbi:MAG: YiiD C-terminal domain-containing protein [Gemmatimonadota bacterium]